MLTHRCNSYLVILRLSKNDGLPILLGIEPECRDLGRECSDWSEADDALLADDDRLELEDLELPELALEDESSRDLKMKKKYL